MDIFIKYSIIQIQSPIVLGLVSESAIHDAVAKAQRQASKNNKKKCIIDFFVYICAPL